MSTFHLVCGNDPLCRRDQSDLKRRGFYNTIPRFWHGLKAEITNIRVSQSHWKGNHWWDIWVDAEAADVGAFHRTISSISPILDPGEPPYREWWTLEGVTVEVLLSATEPDPAWTFTFSTGGYGEKRKG